MDDHMDGGSQEDMPSSPVKGGHDACPVSSGSPGQCSQKEGKGAGCWPAAVWEARSSQ